MKKIYQKLVRDRIPEVITEAGKLFATRVVTDQELTDYTFKKLQEDPCAEEAADIMEIFHFICDRLKIRDSEIMAETTAKRISRGGFNKGLILEWVEEK